MLQLKNYQQSALDTLCEYLKGVVKEADVEVPFIRLTKRPYHGVAQVPLPPYVCLRIPTGGGKTLMACHTVPLVTEHLLHQERSVVLWLVPTRTIREQTLAALKDGNHPYRQALDSLLDSRVRIVDVPEAQSLTRAVFDNETVIIVSTVATARVDNTEFRKIYEQNGTFGDHFKGFDPVVVTKLQKYEGTDDPIPSLANVIAVRRPIVIKDEAHNVRTELSFDMLARFDPSCILEFTATPRQDGPAPSNVLVTATATELKAEEMIKLPIRLEMNDDWRQTMLSAKNMRDELEGIAEQERAATGEYIRPIVLVQAEKKNEELTVEVCHKYLLEDLGIPKEEIAIETGDRNDLEGVNVFAKDCPVRYIITVDKLREGWDCSFAYILCSARDMGSRTAVEQILGRILRMPKAKKKGQDALNKAYAFVTRRTGHEAEATGLLIEALEANGFTKWESKQAIQGKLQETDEGYGGLFRPKEEAPTPAERGERFVVPQLAFWEEGVLENLEASHFLSSGWNLNDYDHKLSEEEYPSDPLEGEVTMIDVTDEGRAKAQFVTNLQRTLALVLPTEIKTPEELALWLDRHIEHPDIAQPQSLIFLMRMVKDLRDVRGLALDKLARDRVRLRDAAGVKIQTHRAKIAQRAFEEMVLASAGENIEVSAKRVFTYDLDNYPANPPYEGTIAFNNHYYRMVGNMNGEEALCAQMIDKLPLVKHWVRNLERQWILSFCLQTATDRFYPDFVAELTDGRIVAVEYKGKQYITNDDSKEKIMIGDLWETKSAGKCVFMMVGAEDYAQRLRALH